MSMGPNSKLLLKQAHPDIERLFLKVAETQNIWVVCTTRGEAEQERAFEEGKSHAHYGQSPHNYTPSFAADVVPLPEKWSSEKRLVELAEFVQWKARELKIDIVWGGEFKGNYGFNRYGDLPHWEMDDWKELKDLLPGGKNDKKG